MDPIAILLRRIRDGDPRAKDELARIILPIARRIAHGRLPASARSLSETEDIASRSATKALGHAETFEMRPGASFLGYLRTIVVHEIVSEIRHSKSRPSGGELDPEHPWAGPSPLQILIGRELFERYERALECLTPSQREAFLLYFELGYKYRPIAEMMGLDSPDAARMLVARASARLAKLLEDARAVDENRPVDGDGQGHGHGEESPRSRG